MSVTWPKCKLTTEYIPGGGALTNLAIEAVNKFVMTHKAKSIQCFVKYLNSSRMANSKSSTLIKAIVKNLLICMIPGPLPWG